MGRLKERRGDKPAEEKDDHFSFGVFVLRVVWEIWGRIPHGGHVTWGVATVRLIQGPCKRLVILERRRSEAFGSDFPGALAPGKRARDKKNGITGH